jgi:predicted membrane channel-forming protein YqfA (hemolysin III family)
MRALPASAIPTVTAVRHNERSATMSNQSVTYLVGACLGVVGLAAFCALVIVPAITAYRRPVERAAVVVLSMYVLAALVGLGVLAGALVVLEWPRFF